jgi:hypothetical protein
MMHNIKQNKKKKSLCLPNNKQLDADKGFREMEDQYEEYPNLRLVNQLVSRIKIITSFERL